MKRGHTVFIIALIMSILIMSKVNGFVEELPLIGKVIYIDAGHGGIDPGANYKDILEKDINLQISKTLSTMLMEKGAIVFLTREGDYDLAYPRAYLRKRSDLARRAKLINDSDCDIYLSIHLNATLATSWHGAQVFYDDINKKNEKIGTIMQENFKKDLGSKRKLKKVSDLYMYKDIRKPGVLLEVGFLSNPNERYLLRKEYYQRKISSSIINGLIEYFNN